MMSAENNRVLIMAGGTGGHIFPGIAVASQLKHAGWQVSWLGALGGMESELVVKENIQIDLISVAGLRGKGLLGWIKMPLTLSKAIFQARAVIKSQRPAVAIGFGGFAAGPGGLAAFITGTPLVIHEQNAIAGMTNRFLAKFAERVFQAFPGAFPKSDKVETVGNPIRETISQLHQRTQVLESELSQRPINILVVGGSRGALALNRDLPAVFAPLLAEGKIKLVHQVGKDRLNETLAYYESAGITQTGSMSLRPFIDDMAQELERADIVVCRSGASTVSEVAAAGKAAIFIPYPYAVDDHQKANANWLANEGAAIVITEKDLIDERFKSRFKQLIEAPEQIMKMAKKAHQMAMLDADAVMAKYCQKFRVVNA